MSETVLLGVNAFFSLASSAFFAAALGATSTSFNTLKATAWVVGKDVTLGGGGVTGDVHIGFNGAAAEVMGTTTVFKFGSCDSGDDLCNACGGDGGSATEGLTIISLILAVLALVFCLLRFVNSGNNILKIANCASGFLCCVLAIAAFGNYSNCYAEAGKTWDKSDVSYGAGFALTVVGAALMFIGIFPAAMAAGSGRVANN